MTTDERRRRRFSKEFRKKQAALVESGEYTIPELSRLYEVTYDTVKNWVKKYGKQSYPSTTWVGCEKDVKRVRELEKEIKALKIIVGEQQIELLYKKKLIEKAKEKLGDDFEKKC